MLNLRISSKKQAKIKLALQGCAGSGKTYSALLLAYGLCGDWSKVAIIDSEHGSADLYASLGSYNVLALEEDFRPETYVEALKVCEEAGMEVIIIDKHLPLLGQPLGIPCQPTRQQLHQLAENNAEDECLHAADFAVGLPHHLHHALQAGLCAQREKRQDGA